MITLPVLVGVTRDGAVTGTATRIFVSYANPAQIGQETWEIRVLGRAPVTMTHVYEDRRTAWARKGEAWAAFRLDGVQQLVWSTSGPVHTVSRDTRAH